MIVNFNLRRRMVMWWSFRYYHRNWNFSI